MLWGLVSALRVPQWTRAGYRIAGRLASLARPSPQTSISQSVFRVRANILPVARVPSASSPSTKTATPIFFVMRAMVSSETGRRSSAPSSKPHKQSTKPPMLRRFQRPNPLKGASDRWRPMVRRALLNTASRFSRVQHISHAPMSYTL
jgi:hypothetical protein